MRRRLNIIILELAILIVALLLLSSCAAVKTQTIVEYRDRYITQTEVRVDSVWLDRYHTEYMRGDTVFVHDSVWLDRWHYEATTDTIIERDSIPYPVEVVREVRVRNAYDKFTARGFWCFVILIIGGIALWVGSKTPYGKMALSAIKLIAKI